MKRLIVLSAALCILAGLLAPPAYGQMQKIKANVPFGFSIGDRAYPAGEYTFSAYKDNIVALEKTDRAAPALVLADRVTNLSKDRPAQVRFQCYADQCFLSQVWIPGQDGGYQLRRSQKETEVAAQATGKYVALMGSPRR